MGLLSETVKHPKMAFGIYFGVGFLLFAYGMRDGTFFILDILAGLTIYKIISNSGAG